jgi:hypothetical protein
MIHARLCLFGLLTPQDIAGSEVVWRDVDAVVFAIGYGAHLEAKKGAGVFVAGDASLGAATGVEVSRVSYAGDACLECDLCFVAFWPVFAFFF